MYLSVYHGERFPVSLHFARLQVYDVSFSSTVQSQLPELTSVCMNNNAYLPAASNATKLQTSGGASFTYFAKNAAWVRVELMLADR